ncbi:MAG: hypothetical protein IPO21_02550 [Bacteroidales bacterium]|nr:hypothetical protein [Bacteroidales bacterium]
MGVADLTLYEIVGAYGTFANKGIYTEPIFVEKIVDKYGNTISKITPKQNEAMSEETAYLMVNLLENVVGGTRESGWGTAASLRGSKYQLYGSIAGKTGTTNDHADGWFIGFTPELVTGIWVGAEERNVHFESIEYGQGARMALPIWGNYMIEVFKESEKLGYSKTATFEKPESVPYWKIDCEEYKSRENQNYQNNNTTSGQEENFY